jgi:hypothetical protein
MAPKPNTLSPSQMEGHNYVVQLEPPERNDERATYGVYDTRSRCVLTGFSAAPGEGEADHWREVLANGAVTEEELPYHIVQQRISEHLPEPPDELWYRQVVADFLLLDSRVKSIASLLSEIRHLAPPPITATVGWSEPVDVLNLDGHSVEVTWTDRSREVNQTTTGRVPLNYLRRVPLRYLWEEGWQAKERQKQEEVDRGMSLQEQAERTRQEARDRAEFERLRTKYGW